MEDRLCLLRDLSKAINITGWDFYPPLLSSLLSQFIVLAGIPSVNAYVSLNFLNMIPVLAFCFLLQNGYQQG